MITFLQKGTGLPILLIIVESLLACQSTTVPDSLSSIMIDSTTMTVESKTDKTTLTTTSKSASSLTFPWLDNYDPSSALEQQIPTPDGYKRLPVKKKSFGHWLRQLPLHPKGTPVLLYNGITKPYQKGNYRVINIDVGKRDLQQCADAIMRLRAEYLYNQKAYDDIHFNYTSGHTIRFSDWSKGKRPKVAGNKVYFSSPHQQVDVSYQQFKRYLTNIYTYAGTASLSKELFTKSLKDIQPGDVFIQGGFPGHAVLVVDVVEHVATGERLFLLAQSYMPAQSIHLLKNPSLSDTPWYSNQFTGTLETPEWTFNHQDLRQFKLK